MLLFRELSNFTGYLGRVLGNLFNHERNFSINREGAGTFLIHILQVSVPVIFLAPWLSLFIIHEKKHVMCVSNANVHIKDTPCPTDTSPVTNIYSAIGKFLPGKLSSINLWREKNTPGQLASIYLWQGFLGEKFWPQVKSAIIKPCRPLCDVFHGMPSAPVQSYTF